MFSFCILALFFCGYRARAQNGLAYPPQYHHYEKEDGRVSVMDFLRGKANSLPETPGVYIMKNEAGEIIYVGKSKKLKNRVTSYFSSSPKSPKTARLVGLIRDFDYILCKTEIEALTLENVLIKKHSPKYNIKLKDAKSYPYIKVSADEYPRLTVTRERSSDRAKYYGPYQGTSGAYSALEAILKAFSLPDCKRVFPRDIGKERPCIYKEMGRCIAPCAGGVSRDDYLERVRHAEAVLSGNVRATVQSLKEKMAEAAENMEFERAALLRDSIFALEKLSEKQKVVADAKINRDVFALFTSDAIGALAVLSIRDGALVSKNEFILSGAASTGSEEAISLIADYYDGGAPVPREVMLAFDAEEDDVSLLTEYLTLVAGRKITVRLPERGSGRALCDMASENAAEAARKHRLDSEREDRSVRELAELLGLSSVPKRIEAYDVSNVGNESIVTSMVVWQDGKMKKSDYRSFKITTTGGADDYDSMKEAVSRRLAHIGDGSPSLSESPDLILLDGGRGHVGAILPLLEEMGIPVFGMVKDDYHKTRALTDSEREISIAHSTGVYSFIYGIQEEAHRFAYKGSQGGKVRSMTRSSLEKISGIGPKKAKILLGAKSLSEIRVSSAEALAKIPGISETIRTKTLERTIYAVFDKTLLHQTVQFAGTS